MIKASDSDGRRRLELIEYAEGEDLVDHKGRSRPIYKPSSPRPAEWRPSGISRWLLGLFPGLRLMVTKSVPAGLPYALLGLLAGLGALLVVFSWSSITDDIRDLRIQPRWILLRAGAVLVLVLVYELLRFGAHVEEHPFGPWTPRVLASLVLPAFVVACGAPFVLDIAPRPLEAAWFAALVVGFGALPGAVAGGLSDISGTSRQQFRIVAGIALVALIALAFGLPYLGVPLFGGLSGAARAAGFRVLPTLLP